MVLPVLLAPAAIGAAKVAAAKLATSGTARKMAMNAVGGGGLKAAAGNYLKTPAKSSALINAAGMGIGDSTTKGSKMFSYIAIACGIALVLFLASIGFGFIKFGEKRRAPPSPMNNSRVSRPTHEERMFTNKPGQNKYRRQLSTGGDEYGGYYGHNPAGFSDSEQSYIHPMNNNSSVQKPQFYIKNPGQNTPNVLSEITMSGDPELEEEAFSDMVDNLMGKDNRRKARMSKSIKHDNYNTGHINQVGEIKTTSNLSASNNFQVPFGTNSGERVIQSYIQPLEKRGVNADALNFASITK